MARFGVSKGMKLFAVTFWTIPISGISMLVLMAGMASPQFFFQGFLILMVPILVIVSPLAVAVLINDYVGLRELERDTVTFKIVGLEKGM